jgi:hypothetical protein
MARRVLDTNVLITHWLRMAAGEKPRDTTRKPTRTWGQELGSLQSSSSTLTPIYIEYVCGQRSAHEVDLARAHLGTFELADEGTIAKQDWPNARLDSAGTADAAGLPAKASRAP